MQPHSHRRCSIKTSAGAQVLRLTAYARQPSLIPHVTCRWIVWAGPRLWPAAMHHTRIFGLVTLTNLLQQLKIWEISRIAKKIQIMEVEFTDCP